MPHCDNCGTPIDSSKQGMMIMGFDAAKYAGMRLCHACAMGYKFDSQGGFFAIDENLIAYAYPSSDYAEQARKNPSAVAKAMIEAEQSLPETMRCAAWKHYRDLWSSFIAA